MESLLTSTTNELIFRGVPDERPIPDLPIERPNFRLLFGEDSGPSSPIGYAEQGSLKGKEKAVDGVQRRTEVGGEDVEVTDKLTMTWVSKRKVPGTG